MCILLCLAIKNIIYIYIAHHINVHLYCHNNKKQRVWYWENYSIYQYGTETYKLLSEKGPMAIYQSNISEMALYN